MLKKLAVVVAASAATLVAGVAPSSAAHASPSGLCGASNMVNTDALPGMLNAMSQNNASGDDGMFVAVANSACSS